MNRPYGLASRLRHLVIHPFPHGLPVVSRRPVKETQTKVSGACGVDNHWTHRTAGDGRNPRSTHLRRLKLPRHFASEQSGSSPDVSGTPTERTRGRAIKPRPTLGAVASFIGYRPRLFRYVIALLAPYARRFRCCCLQPCCAPRCRRPWPTRCLSSYPHNLSPE